MPGRIDRELREQLVSTGQWGVFLQRRDELKAEGYAPREARTTALREAISDRAVGLPGANSAPMSASPFPTLPPCPPTLVGRSGSELEVIRWVARNIDARDPDPAECPSPFAWTLLRQCRESPNRTKWFIERLWVKLIPSRSQLDGTEAVQFDAKPTQDLIARILAARDEAIRETAMRNKEVRESVGVCPRRGV